MVLSRFEAEFLGLKEGEELQPILPEAQEAQEALIQDVHEALVPEAPAPEAPVAEEPAPEERPAPSPVRIPEHLIKRAKEARARAVAARAEAQEVVAEADAPVEAPEAEESEADGSPSDPLREQIEAAISRAMARKDAELADHPPAAETEEPDHEVDSLAEAPKAEVATEAEAADQTPDEEEISIPPEFQKYIADTVDSLKWFYESDGEEPGHAFVQVHGLRPEDLLMRQDFLDRVGDVFGVDHLEKAMTAAKHRWRDLHDNTLVRVEPWMKQSLGVQEDPDQATGLPGMRADLEIANNGDARFILHEIELRSHYTTRDEHDMPVGVHTLPRVIFMTMTRFPIQQAEDSREEPPVEQPQPEPAAPETRLEPDSKPAAGFSIG